MDRSDGRESEALRLSLRLEDEPRRSRAAAVATAALVIAAVACALAPWPIAARAAAAGGLVVLAILAQRLGVRPRRPPRAWVIVDAHGVLRAEPSGSARVVRWGEPFGVTVLANPDRTRLLLAFTTAAQTRFLPVRVAADASQEEQADLAGLLARASTLAETEVQSARGDDPAALRASDAARLLERVATHAGSALERIFLSDARGQPVVLDGVTLRLGARTIDLATPLEWKGFVFQESAGHVVSVYQATWVRQSDTEAVLVAPLPVESSWARDVARGGPLVARELRLMESQPGEPPPREQRFAIDRLFMLPLRQALARAPRASRVPSSPSRPMPEGRA